MFVLFIAGQPMTGQRMFESDEEEDADWQVSALAGGSWEKLKLICSCASTYSNTSEYSLQFVDRMFDQSPCKNLIEC